MPSDQVTLTPLVPADAEPHLAGEDDELARWLGGGPSTSATVAAYLRRCAEQWAAGGPALAFGIRVGPDAALAGTIEVQFDQPYLTPGQVNLAYGLYPAWRGRGIATRAVRDACGYAASRGSKTAVIRVDPANEASASVARRAGFVHRGRVREPDGTSLDWYTRDL